MTTNTPARPGTTPVTTLRTSTASPSQIPDADLQLHFDNIRELARRIDDRDPRTPPWAWTNLTSEETRWAETAVEGFITDYNHTHVVAIEDVIPACWRHHPALAQELLVQFWSWWHCHLNPRTTINAVDDYYERTLPTFQTRLATRLLARSAVNCRKGNHTTSADPELAQAVVAAKARAAAPATLQKLRITTFGTGEPGIID
jgi:hypothetical protein